MQQSKKKTEVWFDPETDRYRVVTPGTTNPVLHSSTGNPLDGGGHQFLDKAERQAGYIEKALKAKQGEQ